MGTKQHSNYESLITFTRASAGHALRPVSYGDELVVNGGFDTDSDWVKGSSWSISGGVASADGTVGGATLRQELTNTAIGDLLFIEYTISNWNSTGTHNVLLGSTASANNTGNGTFYVALVQNGDKEINIQTKGGAAFDVDNVSVKEVTFDESDGTLTLFEHPEGIPRVEWDSAGNRLGMLVEEARTNYIGYSDFSSAWGENLGGAITANQAEGLDKTQSMALLETSGISSGIYANTVNRHTASASGETYTLSVIVKHVAGGTQLRFRLEGAAFTGAIQGIAVDLSDGSFVSNSNVAPDAYEIKSFGNGFYRVSITGTTVASGDIIPVFYGNINEDADFYIGMAQLEAGSFPTSYIKSNSGSTTTRSADVASIPVADFGYNQSAGTISFDFQVNESTANKRLVSLNADNSNNRIDALLLPSNVIQVYTMDGGVNQSFIGTGNTYTDSTMAKFAFSYKKDDYAITLNGGTVVTDTSASVPSVTQLEIGTGPIGDYANGHIKSIKYYPRRLTNAQLVELTS